MKIFKKIFESESKQMFPFEKEKPSNNMANAFLRLPTHCFSTIYSLKNFRNSIIRHKVFFFISRKKRCITPLFSGTKDFRQILETQKYNSPTDKKEEYLPQEGRKKNSWKCDHYRKLCDNIFIAL